MSNKATSDILLAGLKCKCPACDKGRLYDGLLTIRKRCDVCDCELGKIHADDGPATFLIFLVLLIVVPIAAVVHFKFEPALWVHLLLWGPLIIGLTILFLRPAKAMLIGMAFHRL